MNKQTLLTRLTTLALLFSLSCFCHAKEKDKAKHVVLIGLDGWGAYSLPKADMPNVKRLSEMAASYIKEKQPQLFAICFDGPDHTGHTEGHDTPKYYTKLTELDSYVGKIVQSVKDTGIYDDTIFIVTSDHGGINKGHVFRSAIKGGLQSLTSMIGFRLQREIIG